jgi:hypothetical protein
VIGPINADETNGWPRWVRKKCGDTIGEGELGGIDVQVHPVDALDLQGHVVDEHIGGSAG